MERGFMFAVIAAFSVLTSAFGAEETQYYTNLPYRIERAIATGCIDYLAYSKVDPKDRAETDEALASGTNIVRTYIYDQWPKTAARYIASIKDTRPYSYTFWKEAMDLNVRPYWQHCNAEPVKYINARFEDYWAHLSEYNYSDTKKRTIACCSKMVKKQLRKEGKSFVVKGDSNPVQERLDAVSAALDAPKMAGLREALAKCGVVLGPDPAQGMPSDEECRKLIEDVFNGDVPFGTYQKGRIQFFLGVEEYNKFVKRYNGD